MELKQRLDQILEQWNLLRHPFYQAWREGTLPPDALRTYAHQYGAFISLLPLGWQQLNDSATAQEEEEHTELWAEFAQSLDTHIGEARIPEVKQLVETAYFLFEDSATALGALYAFEAQQPATAQSKLEGLRTHYRLPAGVMPYFEIHARNHHEAEKLLARLNQLTPEQQSRAVQACEQMSRALWEALSGIYQECQPQTRV